MRTSLPIPRGKIPARRPLPYAQKRAMSEFAQTVKQQADIVKIVEGYIRLRKSGSANYAGL